MKLFIVLGCLFVFVCCSPLSKPPSPPTWGTGYSVNGTLRLPYAELVEPFSAWYDGKKNRSRVAFYGTTMQTYMIGGDGKHGMSYKLAYMTNQTHMNMHGCFKAEGDADSPVTAQSILPDISNFTLHGMMWLDDKVNVSKWYQEVQHGKKTSKYTMYITADKKPYRYEMYGYDSLLGSHFDKYYVDYTDYNGSATLDDSLFMIKDNKTKCTGFPGPGDAETKILFNPMREYINRDDTHHQEMFAKFKETHNKDYTGVEHARREAIFRQNVRFIHSKNRSPITYNLAVNHLADMSFEELRLRNGRKYSAVYNGGNAFNKDAYTGNLPVNFDWRLYGAVTPVKDQAVCGSCWSFGTTGTIEGAYFLATGKLLRLSQQELMDCSWGYGNNACDGGEEFRAYGWIKNSPSGLATEDEYGAYMGIDGMCHNATGTVQISSWTNVTNDEDAMEFAIYNHGPISIGIDASHPSLSFYANGVYYEEKCGNKPDDLDHAVLAVGFGVMDGEEYWLVKNSWSTYWGNDGYVLMSKRDNNCGVTTAATFVTIKK